MGDDSGENFTNKIFYILKNHNQIPNLQTFDQIKLIPAKFRNFAKSYIAVTYNKA